LQSHSFSCTSLSKANTSPSDSTSPCQVELSADKIWTRNSASSFLSTLRYRPTVPTAQARCRPLTDRQMMRPSGRADIAFCPHHPSIHYERKRTVHCLHYTAAMEEFAILLRRENSFCTLFYAVGITCAFINMFKNSNRQKFSLYSG